MGIFFALMIGFLVGFCFGSIGMFLLIKETREDLLSDSVNSRILDKELEAPWEAEELPEPEEVKYGEF